MTVPSVHLNCSPVHLTISSLLWFIFFVESFSSIKTTLIFLRDSDLLFFLSTFSSSCCVDCISCLKLNYCFLYSIASSFLAPSIYNMNDYKSMCAPMSCTDMFAQGSIITEVQYFCKAGHIFGVFDSFRFSLGKLISYEHTLRTIS